MAKKVSFKWNDAAFRKARTLPAVKHALRRAGKAMADDAGEGYEVRSGVTGGKGRARSAVLPTTPEAIRDNAENNTLLKALGRHT